MKPTENKGSLFRRLSVITLISVYLLVGVGGIVRSTGSGMGCPDWPTCFGNWVPPTEAGQLPANYQEVYAQQRAEKNQRFVKYLEAFGFHRLAADIQHDPSILEEADFNAAKTWTEYVNRLLGALVGLFVVVTFIASLVYLHKDNTLVFFSLLTVLAVGFQGWIGSIVVSTNLLSWMITVHMLLALLVVCLLTYMVVRSGAITFGAETVHTSRVVHVTLVFALLSTLVQIIMGTEVRASVNEVASTFGDQNREAWVDKLGWIFYVHRSYSLLVLAIHTFLMYKVYQISGRHGNLILWTWVLLGTVVLEILTGAVMAYFGIPRFAQPVHLLLAVIAFGLQFMLLLTLNSRRLFSSIITKKINAQHVSYQNYG